jgi:hypothetical protein
MHDERSSLSNQTTTTILTWEVDVGDANTVCFSRRFVESCEEVFPVDLRLPERTSSMGGPRTSSSSRADSPSTLRDVEARAGLEGFGVCAYGS